MDSAKKELLAAWIRAAHDDLGSAKKLLGGDDPYTETAVYHCQQSAEKALKAFLMLRDVEFEKTHNLTLLVQSCADLDRAFCELMPHAEALTPYATLYRYPDEIESADIQQAQEAVEMAQAVLGFVKARLQSD